MAPSPEHDHEPKAPDKNDSKPTTDELRPGIELGEDGVNSELQESSVSTLDDGQLKALLDEAINYKTPKDREGKSKIFKVLLQEAEEDERNARAASASGPQLARYYNTAATRRHRNSTSRRETSAAVSARLTHGGSLQDLAQPDLYSDVVPSGHGANRRRRKAGGAGHHHSGGAGVSVSARQREGGSLPSNVNAGYDHRQLFEEDRGAKSRQKIKPDNKAAPLVANPKKMVETTNDSIIQSPPARPEYTILDIGINADPEETLSLLDNEVVHSYDSTASSESPKEKLIHYSEPQDYRKQDGGFENETVDSTKIIYTAQDAFEDAIIQNRIPRVRYTSRATLEVDGISGVVSSTGATAMIPSSVDKSILFPQFQSQHHETIGALQLDTDYNSVQSLSGAALSMEQSIRSQVQQSPIQGTASSTTTPQYRVLSMTTPKMLDRFHSDKGLDENGNALNSTSHLEKKKKKCKSDRNVVNVLKAEEVEGHRSDIIKNIDLLVEYIETKKDSPKCSKIVHNNHKVPNKQIEKRRTRVKSKSEGVKKSNSLEEISKTKLEDLMSEDLTKVRRVKKQSTSEDGDRRSWGTEDGQNFMCSKRSTEPDFATETEFHVVTKKKKSKKARSSSRHIFPEEISQPHPGGLKSGGHHHHYHQRQHRRSFGPEEGGPGPRRRKSACSVPPSDKSNDSSDVDSVHSLPAGVSSRADQGSQGSGGQGQASSSYADIARTSGNPALLSSSASSNCSSQGGTNNITSVPPQQTFPQTSTQIWKSPLNNQPPPVSIIQNPVLNQEHFPDLCEPLPSPSLPLIGLGDFPSLDQPQQQRGGAPQVTAIMMQNKQTQSQQQIIVVHHGGVGGGGVGGGAGTNTKLVQPKIINKPCDNKSNKKLSINRRTPRPAVIILDDNSAPVISPSDPIQVSGLTFGFELNEQLLNNSDGNNDYDQCMNNSSEQLGATAATVATAAERFTARYIPPFSSQSITHTYNYDKIVSFVGSAWDEIVNQSNGKIQYYNGQ